MWPLQIHETNREHWVMVVAEVVKSCFTFKRDASVLIICDLTACGPWEPGAPGVCLCNPAQAMRRYHYWEKDNIWTW